MYPLTNAGNVPAGPDISLGSRTPRIGRCKRNDEDDHKSHEETDDEDEKRRVEHNIRAMRRQRTRQAARQPDINASLPNLINTGDFIAQPKDRPRRTRYRDLPFGHGRTSIYHEVQINGEWIEEITPGRQRSAAEVERIRQRRAELEAMEAKAAKEEEEPRFNGMTKENEDKTRNAKEEFWTSRGLPGLNAVARQAAARRRRGTPPPSRPLTRLRLEPIPEIHAQLQSHQIAGSQHPLPPSNNLTQADYEQGKHTLTNIMLDRMHLDIYKHNTARERQEEFTPTVASPPTPTATFPPLSPSFDSFNIMPETTNHDDQQDFTSTAASSRTTFLRRPGPFGPITTSRGMSRDEKDWEDLEKEKQAEIEMAIGKVREALVDVDEE